MHAATKDKAKMDTLQNSTECETINNDKPLVREEEAKEADINFLISKYGYQALLGRPEPQYGDWDFTQGLQQYYESAREARELYDRLPDHVKERYSREEFWGKLNSGEDIDLTEPQKENVTEVTKD